jgi:hypothetical protein
MPRLIRPKNAVTVSIIANVLHPALGYNEMPRRTVKRIPFESEFRKRSDVLRQHTVDRGATAWVGSHPATSPLDGPPEQPLIHHDNALPISAVFALRYVHTLVRKWAASGMDSRRVPKIGMRPVEW